MDLRGILEIIYFLSGPLLVILATLGLYQLKISKENARITAKREAYSLAAKQCDFFREMIIPLTEVIDSKINKNKLTFFHEPHLVEINKEGNILINLASKADAKTFKSVSSNITSLFNCLESFSIFFTGKVADERMAFVSVGKIFCKEIRLILPYLESSKQRGPDDWKPVFDLFIIWSQRIEKIKLDNEKKNIDK